MSGINPTVGSVKFNAMSFTHDQLQELQKIATSIEGLSRSLESIRDAVKRNAEVAAASMNELELTQRRMIQKLTVLDAQVQQLRSAGITGAK